MPKTVETRVGVCYNDFKYCTKGETGMLISLVVPCYNEEESLPIFYKEASKIAQQMGISHGADFEFIFVDDGSKDRTLQIARELHRKDARVRYISFSRNFGKEAGIYAGLKAAKGDYVATMDADLQDPPSLLPEMLDYRQMTGLSNEVIAKLNDHKPVSIGQASRISGVTPAAISILLVWLKKQGMLRRSA